jgi:NAD(P)H-nitrite reductase large subunit
MKTQKHIVILGNGISGITAAIEIRKKSNYKISIISNETTYFFSRTALMYVYMGQLKFEQTQPYENSFWKQNKIELLFEEATDLDTENKKIILQNTILDYDILILACGSKPAFYNWNGQHLKGVQGLYSAQDLNKIQENTQNCKHAVVVGGGLIGVEMAEMLHSRNISTSILVREKTYWQNVLPAQEGKIIETEIKKHGINLKFETELEEIIGENNIVSAIKTKQGETIPCNFVGICTGVTPNIDFLKPTAIETNKGILVNEYLETNIIDIYAIGDCAQQKNPPPNRKNIEQVWYTGRIMGETIAKTICGERTVYNPGIWFNSSKFFTLEYQVYGIVDTQPNKENESFYWENENKNIALRISYNKSSKFITGIHSIGMRLKQSICENWIKNNTTVHTVIEELHKANFNPEFYKKYEKEIQLQFHLLTQL